MAPNEGSIKLNVYGRGKTGKTRFACTFPKPLLLIGTEDGTKSLTPQKGLDFVRIMEPGDLDHLADLLKQGRYKSAVLDQAGGLQDQVLKEVLRLDEIPVQRSWGMADQRTWGAIGQQTKERLRRLLDLADSHAMNIVIIAHERNFKEEEDQERLAPDVGPALTPTVAGWLNGACDYICQTYIRDQTVQKNIAKAGAKPVISKQKTGVKEYCLRVGAHSIYMTGFRHPDHIELPDSLVNPHYDQVAALIRGEEPPG